MGGWSLLAMKHEVRRYGVKMLGVAFGFSVFDPVEVPQCQQRYSYRFPVGRMSRRRSLVGVAIRQRGQYSNDALRDWN